MFTWICPKCGKEVPPSYSECPNCAAQGQTAAPVAAQPVAAVPPSPPASTGMRPTAPHAAQPGGVHIPHWLVTVLFAVGFAALLGGGYWLYRSIRDKPQAMPAAAVPGAPATETPGPATAGASPVLKNVELTGLRLTEEKQKAMLQFVIVNHSAADLGDISGKGELKAAAGPVGTFSFKTSLGPYESKDLKVPVTTKLRVYELPDWQFLRAEITNR